MYGHTCGKRQHDVDHSPPFTSHQSHRQADKVSQEATTTVGLQGYQNNVSTSDSNRRTIERTCDHLSVVGLDTYDLCRRDCLQFAFLSIPTTPRSCMTDFVHRYPLGMSSCQALTRRRQGVARICQPTALSDVTYYRAASSLPFRAGVATLSVTFGSTDEHAFGNPRSSCLDQTNPEPDGWPS